MTETIPLPFGRFACGTALTAILVAAPAGEVARAQAQTDTPGCWVRGDRSELGLRASPLDSTSLTLAAGTIKVCYSRPQRRGRPIMGGLVPFGEPWRLGANEATTIYLSFPAKVAGASVEPGTYSLYAVPGESEWRIVVNAGAQRWGIPIHEGVRSRDVGSGKVATKKTEAPEEMLTLTLRRTSDTSAELDVAWEETRVSVPIVAR